MQYTWAEWRERKIFREGFSGFNMDSGLGDPSQKVTEEILGRPETERTTKCKANKPPAPDDSNIASP